MRQQGRQKRTEAPVTPAVEAISDGLPMGVSQRAVARECGIDESTVHYYVESVLHPKWEQSNRSRVGKDLARVEVIDPRDLVHGLARLLVSHRQGPT